jgi:hypothetical protein
MKTKIFIKTVSATLLAILSISFGQSKSSGKIAVLPFEAVGVEEMTIQSAESLLKMEIEKIKTGDLVSEKQVDEALGEAFCAEIPCAIEIGNKLGVEEIVMVKLIALGEKVIAEYKLIGVAEQKVLVLDQATAATIEDLDVTMKRIAASITRKQSAEKTAEVGLITEKETETPRRRSARKFAGFSFGYLYPQNGYDDSDRSFSMDFRTGAEINNSAFGMQLAVRKGFAMNIFASYLTTKKDFCPYFGGAFGFHWVSHDSYYNNSYEYGNSEPEEKKEDGFELTANTGLLAFRTYNVQIIMNLAYAYTLNDYDDQALIFTIGLIK